MKNLRLFLFAGFLGCFGGVLSYAQGIFISPRTVFGTVNGITRPIPNATVTVCAAGSSGIPCSPALAGTLFKDAALTQPLANPTQTDSSGNYPQMAVAGGTYTLTESAAGFAGFSYQIVVACAPGICAITSLTATSATITGALTAGSVNNVFSISASGDVGANYNTADMAVGCTGVSCVIELPPFNTATATTAIAMGKNHTFRIRGSGTLTVTGSGTTPAITVPDSTTDVTGVSVIDCPEHATIKLANSSNSAVIQDTNFVTLSGSGNTFGTFGFTLRGCTIDGNKANQTALVTTGSCTVSNVARTAGGVVTITCSNTPSPAFAAGMDVVVGGNGALANEITNDNSSFNGRFIVQSATPTTFTYNQTARNTIASVAATGTTPIAVGYSGGSGVRIFGRHFDIEDVSIANNICDGLWNEGYTPGTFVDLTNRLESTVRRLRMIGSGCTGWVHWGPQNSKAWDVVTFNHGFWGREIDEPLFSTENVDFLNTAGGTRVQGLGVLQSSGDQPTSGTGIGLLLDAAIGPSEISSASLGCNSCTGVEVRSTNQQVSGTIQNSNPGLTINGGSGLFLLNVAGNNTGNLVQLTSENGNSTFLIQGHTDSNTGCFSTTPAGNDFVIARTNAGTACSSFQVGASAIVSGGWTQTLPTGVNSTFALLGLAQTYSAINHLGSNVVQLTADASPIATTTPGTTFLTFGALPVSTNFSFACKILYNQQTAAGGVGLAVQGATNAPTRLDAWGTIYTTNPSSAAPAESQSNLANLASTTATAVVSATPSAITTVFQAELNGTIQVGASASTLNILMFTGAGADTVTPKAGSYCYLY